MSRKMNWWRAGKNAKQSTGLLTEREFEASDKASKWIERVEAARKWPSKSEIVAKRTKRGGWTRATLAAWGVPWPPPAGWREALEMKDAAFFDALKPEEPRVIKAPSASA